MPPPEEHLLKAAQTNQLVERYGTRIVLVTLFLILAVVIAYWVGAGDTQMLIWCVELAGIGVITLGIQKRAWVFIALGWVWTGATAVLPYSMSIRDTSILMAIVAYIGYQIINRNYMTVPRRALDWIVLLNLVWLVITLVIHPVGFNVLGAEKVGARPYFSVALAVLAYHVLVRGPESPKTAGRIPLLILIGSILLTSAFLLSYLFPGLPEKIPILFAALDVNVFGAAPSVGAEIPRYQRMADLGLMIPLVLTAYYPPTTLFNPLRWRFWLFMIAIVCVLAGGFRNVTLWVLATLVLSSWLHRGWHEVLLVGVCAILLIGVVTISQGRLFELPATAQRSLAFLPGRWSEAVLEDAATSNEGRFQWWRDIIKYHAIKNWWVGDGFGTDAHDLALLANRGVSEEFIMYTGAYHNGPLTAIHYVGVVGLLLLYGLMAVTAMTAVQCVHRCRGSPLLALAIFVAVQTIWYPVHYTFVFGAYDSQMPTQILLAGLARLVLRMADQQNIEAPPKLAPVALPRAGLVTPLSRRGSPQLS